MATIKDISKKSGFSITTVSRALNGYDDVNEETRKKIIDIANSLKYTPNKSAQNLVKKQNKTIALILSGLENNDKYSNFDFSLFSGMYTKAKEADYEVILLTTNTSYQKNHSYYEFCNSSNICGAVISGIKTDDPYFKELVNSNIPCIVNDIKLAGPNINAITIDNAQASCDIVQYLIDNNHTHIAMINGIQEAEVSHIRLEGYKRALEQNNIPYRDEYVEIGNFNEKDAYLATKKLLKENKNITAIFSASDLMAISSIKAIKDTGKRVPEDISVVGFDDILIASYSTPTLTTVRQDFFKRGEIAVIKIIEMLNDNLNCNNVINMPYEIIKRESVAKNITSTQYI